VYFSNAKRCWIIAKADKEAIVKEVFKETAVNETVKEQNTWKK